LEQTLTPSVKRRTFIAIPVLAILGAGLFFMLKSDAFYKMSHHMGGHEGMQGGMHDEANMPGLRGENATDQETAELAAMFRNFETITREVENLPKGIRTVTRSSDPEVMDQLTSHVIGMIDRVETMDDPKIFIQSPTLDIFFAQGDQLTTEIDLTDDGIIVVQTTENPELVRALHEHAAEVTAMSDRGMAAVHEMMQGNH
jgi:hypothetical protein